MSRPIQPLPSVQQPWRRCRTHIAGVMAAALVISWGGPAANAFWQTLSSTEVGAKADSLQELAAPTASVSAGAASVGWSTRSTAAGRSVSGYTVARYSSADGTKVAAGGGCAGTVTALTCIEATLPAGSWYYTVTPVLGSWAGPESARSTVVTAGDTTPPGAPTISAAGIVNKAKVTGAPVSGTAEPSSTVVVTATDKAGLQRSSQPASVDTAGQWSVSSFDLTDLSDGAVNYTAVATDAAGNASGPSTAKTTTKDTVAPTASIKFQTGPANQKNVTGRADQDDQIVITFSEPMNPASICNSWSATSQATLKNAGIQVRIDPSKTMRVVVPATVCPIFTLGTGMMGGAFSSGSSDLVFAGGGNNATAIAWSTTPTSSTVTITLGPVETGTRATVSGTVQPTFTAASGPQDASGNPISLAETPGVASNF
jgi:hypothetical protein